MSNYELFLPPVTPDFDNWGRREARRYLGWFVGQIDHRISVLRAFIDTESPDCVLDLSPDSLFCLGEFFFERVETRPSTAEELEEQEKALPDHVREYIDLPEWDLTEVTLSLCVDVGIYLAETLRREYPNLAWDLWTQKTVGYHRPVLRGFTADVPMDPIIVAVNLARSRVESRDGKAALREVFDVWARKVPQ